MGKKTNKTKTAAPVKRAAKTKPAAENVTTPEPARAKPKTAARPAAAKPTARKNSRKPGFSQRDIALRAYFIAERRMASGLHGDPHQDWIEAERQLSSEAGSTATKKVKKA